MGWIGSGAELHAVMTMFKLDQDEEGRFLIKGQVASFLGMGDEFVLGDDAEGFLNGNPVRLVPLLAKTSYGMQVVVL